MRAEKLECVISMTSESASMACKSGKPLNIPSRGGFDMSRHWCASRAGLKPRSANRATLVKLGQV